MNHGTKKDRPGANWGHYDLMELLMEYWSDTINVFMYKYWSLAYVSPKNHHQHAFYIIFNHILNFNPMGGYQATINALPS